MSTPPARSDNPTAQIFMDRIIHNIARKQQLKSQQSQKKRSLEQRPSSPGLEQPISGKDESPENPMTDYFTLHSSQRPRKGILKSPTVHFPEELGVLDDEDLPNRVLPVLSPKGAIGHSLYYDNAATPGLPPPPPPVRTLPAPPPPPPVDAPQPPTLFDRAIEADEYLNEAAYKLYTKFIDELSEFVDMQGEVIRTRLAVQEKRQELKRFRENVSQSDMLLIDYLRKCMTSGISSDDEKLVALFEASQAARDQVGPVEAEYEPMEIGLGADEHQLKEKYTAIENRFEHFFRLNATSTTQQSVPSRIEYETETGPSVSGDQDTSGNTPRAPDLFHGTIIGDYVEVGQLPLRAGDMHGKLQDPDVRGFSRMPTLSSDTQDPSKKLRSSATVDEPIEDDIPTDLLGIAGAESVEMTQSQEIETRDRRISQSLKGVASHTVFEFIDRPGSLPDDISIDSTLHEVDSLLLIDEDIDTQSTLSGYLTSFKNTRDRVNQWLLHRLRISTSENYALKRQVTVFAPGVSHWAALALSEWPNDLLGYGQTYHQGSIESKSDSQCPPTSQNATFPAASSHVRELGPQDGLNSSSNSNPVLPTVSNYHETYASTIQNQETLGYTGIIAASMLP
ncbi:Nn.00g107420.m01.CDS01 [Neocucurbitaria sp. VM-36]